MLEKNNTIEINPFKNIKGLTIDEKRILKYQRLITLKL